MNNINKIKKILCLIVLLCYSFTILNYFQDYATTVVALNTGFNTYSLTDDELLQIASLCQQEQGTDRGAAAEASLMANRYEMYGYKYSSLYDYVRNCKWFANAATVMNRRNARSSLVDVVRKVLIDGKRTLPGYIDEHDCFSDLSKCSNNGSSINIRNKSQYIQFVTKIENRYGSVYTFYSFPDNSSDPFGYINSSKRNEMGDFCYDFDTWLPIGTPIQNDDELGISYPRPSGNPPIKNGSSGNSASWLQSALNILGYGLNVDGKIGTLSVNAIKDFQYNNELSVDGIAGTQTISKLVSVIKNRLISPDPPPVIPDMPSTINVSTGSDFAMTTFTWNSCANADWYDVRINDVSGNNILTQYNIRDTKFTYPLISGNYSVSIASVNSNGKYQISEYKDFYIGVGNAIPLVKKIYNGHIYVLYDCEVSYSQATEVAKYIGGHLVTITSAEENAFVADLKASGKFNQYWLGATDSVTEGTFKWCTGEEMSYTNWDTGQPDNCDNNENCLLIWSNGKWNDAKDYSIYTGFIVEIEDQKTINSGIFNGNEYEVIEGELTWTESKAYCEMLGGHLAYISDAEENEFIHGLIATGNYNEYWIGGENLTKGSYQWTDGNNIAYTNWEQGQPDNYGNTEHYIEMYKNGKWNDNNNVKSNGHGFVCEYENTFSKNLTLEEKTDTTIMINWTGVKFATGYNIYLDGSKIATVTGSSYEFTELNPLTQYEIYVEAVSNGELIGKTDIESITTAQKVTFSGKGTESEPYLIANTEDLYCMANTINDPFLNKGFGMKCYRQTADIDLSQDYFPSIGSMETPFCGIYDGAFFTISGLYETNGGLFGQVGRNDNSNDVKIKNLKVTGTVNGTTNSMTGGIASRLCGNAAIINCAVVCDVYASDIAGGIVGELSGKAVITDCYHNGSVTAGEISGGIAGQATSGILSNCYHTGGKVIADQTGGITGNDSSTSAMNCFYLKGTAASGTIKNAKPANDIVMKELADTLGESYSSDIEGINDGYPILVWEKPRYDFKGSGTVTDPYQINSSDDFIQMAEYVNSDIFNSTYGNVCYIQNVDIIFNELLWSSIGNSKTNSFNGQYDGNQYTIYNLKINESDFAGLFGYVGESGYIHNITVYNGSSSSSNGIAGGIASVLSNGARISDCAFIGLVSGNNGVGGIVGKIENNGIIKNCYQTGSVKGNINVGGVVGTVSSGTASISNSYHAGGKIVANSNYGGISGAISNDTKITNCYYVKSDASYGVNSGNSSGAIAVTSNVLKMLASDLGEEYDKNISEYFNEGYPVFKWQDFSKANNVIYGDLNNDYDISVADAVILQKYLLAIESLSFDKWMVADMNQDGSVDVFDMVYLKKLLVSINNDFEE